MSHPFQRIAIVNRGEPAMRLIHAVREFNREHDAQLRPIALYTEPDRHAMFVREADEAYDLGSALFIDPKDGERKVRYLDYVALERALTETRAEAVWVGWGFVSERADFVELCDRLGIVFIGPSAEVMRKLGDKITSKLLAEAAGVPVAPWSGGPVETLEEAHEHARRLGYPLMIKATAGGGGRGIRIVRVADELQTAFESARNEARNGFGDPTVFFEKRVTGAHHIEVQLIADGETCWAVGVRDCTLQRRHQKVLEETPSPVLTPEQDREVRDAAVRLGKLVGYTNAGTVEFLYDPERKSFAFMEVNTRLQVEHPVTELTTGLDLVKLQIHIARGGKLEGEPPPQRGHAIELRLNAEDPDNAFAPAPGLVELFRIPTGPGVRVDTGVEEGDEVAPQFDSMIAKIMAYGRDRKEALARLQRVLAGSAVALRGGMSNKGFLMSLLENPDVQACRYDIAYLDRLVAAGEHTSLRHAEIALIQAAILVYDEELAVERAQFFALASRGRPEVRGQPGRTIELGYRGNSYQLEVYRLGPRQYQVTVDGRTIDVAVEPRGASERKLFVGGRHYRVFSLVHGITHLVEVNGVPHRISMDQGGAVRSPAPAVVVAVNVKEGDQVAVGDRLVVLEAMKMELSVLADFAGTVREVAVRNNLQVATGTPLLFIEPTEEEHAVERAGRVQFEVLGCAAPPDDLYAVCQRNLDEVESLMLGYDVDPTELRRLLSRQGMFCEGLPPEEERIRRSEDEILNIFADITALFRRQRADDELGEQARQSTEEYLFTYLRDLDARGRHLPAAFVGKLEKVLAYYGVRGLERTPELEESLFRIAKAHQQIEQRIVPILSILERRRTHLEVLAPFADEEFRALLDRLVGITQGLFPAVNDAAREVRYRYFNQPLLRQARQQAYRDAEEHLAQLAREPDAAHREEHIQALVACSQPLHSLLSSRFETAEPEVRPALLEAMMRRYYRIRNLETIRAETIDGQCFATAEYDHEGNRVHVVTTHASYARLAEVAALLSPIVERYPAHHDLVADFYVWKDGPLGDADATAAEVLGVINAAGCPRPLRRVVITLSGPETVATVGGTRHFTLRPSENGYWEERFYGGVMHRGLHPMMAKRMNFWRLANFDVERLPSAEDVYLLRAVAKENPRDERFIGVAEVRDLTPVRDASGRVVELPHLERMFMEVVEEMRHAQALRPARQRLNWNRILLYAWPPLTLRSDEFNALVRRLAPVAEGVGLEAVMVHVNLRHPRTGALRETVVTLWNVAGGGVSVRFDGPKTEPLKPLGEYEQKVLGLKQRGLYYPYELIKMLAGRPGNEASELPPGEFQEYDLDDANQPVPVDRPYGKNRANIVFGVIRNFTPKYPEGMERVILLGDPTKGMGNLAEGECLRINAGLELAQRKGIPCEWFALSGGARIAMDSGTENMDWIALTLRRIVEYTQAGGELNIVSVGINVGAQPYWNAEATMLMHTRGILIMTPDAAMVLTGKQALDYSGGVSAEDNFGIGGYDRIMGPNGQAQYGARDLTDACRILLRYYEHSYVVPGDRFPRRAATSDAVDRDVRRFPHGRVDGTHFDTVGDVFSEEKNAGRKKPFDIRKIMRSVTDQDHEPLERWYAMQDAEIGVVWDAHVGGYPISLLGLESRPLPRLGFIPADGPDVWTGGTLFPRSSKKVARAINAASNNRPVVVLANLSGFDGSPESMRSWQLEYGAEIGRAVVNFKGPIVFVVVSRYHGGAFVVFSNRLNENLEIAAVEGTYASVIGGAPAAAVVFAREVKARAQGDERVRSLERQIKTAEGGEKVRLQARLKELFEEVHSEKLGEVADEFDHVHSVHRAKQVGSVHRIIRPEHLRPYIVDALERGMQKELARIGELEGKIRVEIPSLEQMTAALMY
jgi:acetyl/propionyl-CoA carboxylase alpha subunit/acetyl-CoA carboxylase carboxyltransferase component